MRARSGGERRESRAEWRRAWRSVPYADQKRIRDALRRGAEGDVLQIVLGAGLAAIAAADFVGQRIERGRLRRAAESNRALADGARYAAEQT